MELVNFKFETQRDIKYNILRSKDSPISGAHRALKNTIELLIENGYYFSYVSGLAGKANWYETKNYKWIVFKNKKFNLLIRWYGTHLTLYFYRLDPDYYGNRISFASIYADRERMDDDTNDEWIDYPLDKVRDIFKAVIEHYKKDKLWMIWNSAALPRPDYVKCKCIYKTEDINHIDDFGFCMEELAQINLLVSVDLSFSKLCEKHIGLQFKIPQYSSGFYTGIIKADDGDIYFTTLEDGEEGIEDLYRVYMWTFDKVYPFLTYLDIDENS